MDMAYRTLDLEYGGGSLATLWLNRPGQGNAVDSQMIGELTAAFADFNAAASLRAVVLAARGPVFCAGAAPADTHQHADAARPPGHAALAALLDTIHACRVPVVARVQGDCLGLGLALVAACDIVLAAGQAGFCLNNAGEPASVMLPWLTRAMPARAAQRYLLTGERFAAFEARQLGLVHEMAAADALDERMQAILGPLLQADPQALAERRQLLRRLEVCQPHKAV